MLRDHEGPPLSIFPMWFCSSLREVSEPSRSTLDIARRRVLIGSNRRSVCATSAWSLFSTRRSSYANPVGMLPAMVSRRSERGLFDPDATLRRRTPSVEEIAGEILPDSRQNPQDPWPQHTLLSISPGGVRPLE